MSVTRGRIKLAVFGAVLLEVPGICAGGLIEFEDKNEWIAAVDAFTTIHFTEFPNNTFLSNQYADLGVLFADGNDIIFCCDEISYPEDGAGLDGNGNITLLFDQPQAWIAADFPGSLRIELYRDGQLLHTSGIFGIGGGIGNFGGLISNELFDMAILMDVPKEFQANIDNLHFGVPAPGALWMLGLAALCSRRRRRNND